MRIKLFLKIDSAEASRQFYEDELAMFRLHGEIWEGTCALRMVGNEDIRLHLAPYYDAPPQPRQPAFSIGVKNCDKEFARLRATSFASGGRLMPQKGGVFEVFEYPGGKNFMMEDPSGNRLLIAEDYTELEDE